MMMMEAIPTLQWWGKDLKFFFALRFQWLPQFLGGVKGTAGYLILAPPATPSNAQQRLESCRRWSTLLATPARL